MAPVCNDRMKIRIFVNFNRIFKMCIFSNESWNNKYPEVCRSKLASNGSTTGHGSRLAEVHSLREREIDRRRMRHV